MPGLPRLYAVIRNEMLQHIPVKKPILLIYQPRNEIRTPAATAEPITPEMFELMQ